MSIDNVYIFRFLYIYYTHTHTLSMHLLWFGECWEKKHTVYSLLLRYEMILHVLACANPLIFFFCLFVFLDALF